MIKRKVDLPKKLIYLFRKHELIIVDFTFFFKQFFLIQFYKRPEFSYLSVKKILEKKINLFLKFLNLDKKISYNYKINFLKINKFYKKISNNFLKKFIFILSIVLFYILIVMVGISYFLNYIYKNLLSKILKKKLKRKYYKTCFFYYWYFKTRSFKIKNYINLFFKIIFTNIKNYFLNIYNTFLKKIYFYLYLYIFFKKLIKFIFIKLFFFIFIFKFFFYIYINILKYKLFFNEELYLNLILKVKNLKKLKKNNFYHFILYYIKFFCQNIIENIQKKNIFFFINYISKLNVKLIFFFQSENKFFCYFFKNINNWNLLSKYWNLYLILCFYHILNQRPYYYINYFFFKNNDFFELVFFNIYFSVIFCIKLRFYSLNFLYELIPNIIFLKKYLLKLKKYKLFNIFHILRNKIFFKKKN